MAGRQRRLAGERPAPIKRGFVSTGAPAGVLLLVLDHKAAAVPGVAVQANHGLGHALQVLLEEAVGVEDGGAELVALLNLRGQTPVQLGVQPAKGLSRIKIQMAVNFVRGK